MTIPPFLLETVCPALGLITSNLMFSAPVRDVIKANKRGKLCDLNPLPWVFTLSNCLGYIIYACLKQDIWLMAANTPAMILSVWLNVSASKLQYVATRNRQVEETCNTYVSHQKQSLNERKSKVKEMERMLKNRDSSIGYGTDSISSEDDDSFDNDSFHVDGPSNDDLVSSSQERALLAVITFWTGIAFFISFATSVPRSTMITVVGFSCIANLIFFYAAPLSSVYTVIKTKDSSPFHFPTTIGNTVNSCFWVTYGIAIMDPYVFVPNTLGLALSVVQIALLVIFPSSDSD